jgi:hypothetical protein
VRIKVKEAACNVRIKVEEGADEFGLVSFEMDELPATYRSSP